MKRPQQTEKISVTTWIRNKGMGLWNQLQINRDIRQKSQTCRRVYHLNFSRRWMRGMPNTWYVRSRLEDLSCPRSRTLRAIKDLYINLLILCHSGKISIIYQMICKRPLSILISTRAMIDQWDLTCVQRGTKTVHRGKIWSIKKRLTHGWRSQKVIRSPWWAAKPTPWRISWNLSIRKT